MDELLPMPTVRTHNPACAEVAARLLEIKGYDPDYWMVTRKQIRCLHHDLHCGEGKRRAPAISVTWDGNLYCCWRKSAEDKTVFVYKRDGDIEFLVTGEGGDG